ncbi:MAG: hypothetical protein QOD38_805 [Acidimicrobiaceae bacterium]|jgi:predicted phage gp36 major capsid-like protein
MLTFTTTTAIAADRRHAQEARAELRRRLREGKAATSELRPARRTRSRIFSSLVPSKA